MLPHMCRETHRQSSLASNNHFSALGGDNCLVSLFLKERATMRKKPRGMVSRPFGLKASQINYEGLIIAWRMVG